MEHLEAFTVRTLTRVCLDVLKSARARRETYVGPATSTIDFKFLEACFKAGLLEYWSAVSVHPYRLQDPETAGDEAREDAAHGAIT